MNDRRKEVRRKTPRPGGRRATDQPADWLTVTDFARIYAVDRATVYKWLRSALLQTYQVGKILRIRNLPPDQHGTQSSDPSSSQSVDRR